MNHYHEVDQFPCRITQDEPSFCATAAYAALVLAIAWAIFCVGAAIGG